MRTTTSAAPATATNLSLTRLHLMRAGYLLMAVGLAIVKWPLLPEAHTLPLYQGVTLCLLTAMSLLALLGLRYPVKLLPLLLFETAWKLLWLSLVALPKAASGGLDVATTETVVSPGGTPGRNMCAQAGIGGGHDRSHAQRRRPTDPHRPGRASVPLGPMTSSGDSCIASACAARPTPAESPGIAPANGSTDTTALTSRGS